MKPLTIPSSRWTSWKRPLTKQWHQRMQEELLGIEPMSGGPCLEAEQPAIEQ